MSWRPTAIPADLLRRLRRVPTPPPGPVWSVFGDWLCEQGDDRGAQMAGDGYGITWLDGVEGLSVPRGIELVGRHGFVVEVEASSRADIGALGPFLRELAVHPTGCLWTTLDLSERQLGDDGLAAVIDETVRRCVVALDLAENDLTAAGLAALLDGDWPELRELRLSYNPLDDADALVDALASVPRLERLLLRRASLGAAGCARLVTSDGLPGLRHLDLGSNELGADIGSALADSGLPERLEGLCLTHNRLGPRGLAALARRPWPALSTLHLEANQLRPGALGSLPDAPRLADLAVGLNRLGGAVADLLDHPSLDGLERLSLARADLTPDDARTLAASVHLRHLAHLNLAHNEVGDDGVAALAAGPAVAMRGLDLQRNWIGDDGARALAESAALPARLWLGLRDNRIRSEGADALLRHRPDWRIDLAANPIGASVRRRLSNLGPH